MPKREDLEYAVPRCYARTMTRNGQHGIHHHCYTPMVYVRTMNLWRCEACGAQTTGEFITHRLEYAA
jgi:ribosomal protein L37AE/L43A